MSAFGAAMFLIFIVLLAQFNKFTSVILVLTCVVMAIVGALLGMLLTGQTFVIVMSGIGFIALTGVVVNNNIVLIDTYDHLRREGMDKLDAILQTCRERVRPVVLTALTAILGVLPIAFGYNLEILSHETTLGAPSTQWWISLSSAIVFGLAFSTVLTLVVTPSMLMIVTRWVVYRAASEAIVRPTAGSAGVNRYCGSGCASARARIPRRQRSSSCDVTHPASTRSSCPICAAVHARSARPCSRSNTSNWPTESTQAATNCRTSCGMDS
jgi:hypothetical protein